MSFSILLERNGPMYNLKLPNKITQKVWFCFTSAQRLDDSWTFQVWGLQEWQKTKVNWMDHWRVESLWRILVLWRSWLWRHSWIFLGDKKSNVLPSNEIKGTSGIIRYIHLLKTIYRHQIDSEKCHDFQYASRTNSLQGQNSTSCWIALFGFHKGAIVV